jgi:hypothetical protein
MSHGHLIEESTPDALGGRDVAGTVISFRLTGPPATGDLPGGPWDQPADRPDEFSLHTDTPTRVLAALTQWAIGQDVELSQLTVVRPSLEDVYLRLTSAPPPGRRDGR